MAYGSYPLNKIQLGRETTRGTPVAATVLWRGQFSMLEDMTEKKEVAENIGQITIPERMYTSSVGARLVMPPSSMTFEHLPHILEASIKTATPSGAGPYVRVYNFPTDNTTNTFKTYTIEAGNVNVPADQHEMAYAYVDEAEFSGRIKETWMMGATWLGRQMSVATMTSSLAIPTVTDALFNKTKLYIDAAGGTIGTTQKTGVLVAARIRVKPGILQVPVGDGQLYFHSLKPGRPSVDFSITIELEDASVLVTERLAWVNNTGRLIRLLIDESANNKIQFDMAARYDKVGNYESSEGNTLVTLDGHAVLDTTASLFFTTTVTNGTATM